MPGWSTRRGVAGCGMPGGHDGQSACGAPGPVRQGEQGLGAQALVGADCLAVDRAHPGAVDEGDPRIRWLTALWPSERCGRITVTTISKRFADYRAALGLGEGLDFHSLRPRGRGPGTSTRQDGSRHQRIQTAAQTTTVPEPPRPAADPRDQRDGLLVASFRMSALTRPRAMPAGSRITDQQVSELTARQILAMERPQPSSRPRSE
jgi:hypothetical protein